MMTDRSEQTKTHIWHGEQCYFVSTIRRKSGTMIAPESTHIETMAWECDSGFERGKLVAQAAGGRGIDQHFDVCRQLQEHGEYDESLYDDDE